jgi:HEAT repeat protein
MAPADEQLTPELLFEAFRSGDNRRGHEAMDRFLALPDKRRFLKPTLEYLATERNDGARAWAAGVLAALGGDEAFDALEQFLRRGAGTRQSRRQHHRYTRFFSLKAIHELATTPERTASVNALTRELLLDGDEDILVTAAASILASVSGDPKALTPAKDMIAAYRQDSWWRTWAVLRALREFPVEAMRNDVIDVLRESRFLEHRALAIRTLVEYPPDPRITAELVHVVREAKASSLRLAAVVALGRMGSREAQECLLEALEDENAEVRVQAAYALRALFGSVEEAVGALVQRALDVTDDRVACEYVVEAIRLVDDDRSLAAEVLRKEMGSEQQARARAAEEVLINLGGWAAIQRLSQRRATLRELDALLERSEEVVKDTFRDTIRQARLNFYFAMAVNVVVVLVGIALIAIAIAHLLDDPERLAAWILPGATGVIGIVVNMLFNDPRRNAREDLLSLMNVNVLFLGFLRQVNQIDATFKHAYMENADFGAKAMRQTLGELEHAVATTLDQTARYLQTDTRGDAGPRTPADAVREEAEEVVAALGRG